MRKIDLIDNGKDNVHCILCGENITNDGELTGECEHIHFIHISESEEPVFDKNNIYNKIDKYDSLYDLMKENFNENNLEIFTLTDIDKKSGNVWKGPFNRLPAKRYPRDRF